MRIPLQVQRRRARIEIIPLIDIIFFLLATFMMVSLSMVKSRAIPVNLPSAQTGAPQEAEDFVAITVTEAGDIFWNKENSDLPNLRKRLRALKSQSPNPRVVIHGDRKAFFGTAIAVLDEVRASGITRAAIQTKGAPIKEEAS